MADTDDILEVTELHEMQVDELRTKLEQVAAIAYKLRSACQALPIEEFVSEDPCVEEGESGFYIDHDKIDAADYKDNCAKFDEAMLLAASAVVEAQEAGI